MTEVAVLGEEEVARSDLFSVQYRWATIGLIGLVTLIAFEAMAVATAMPVVVESLDGLALYGWAFTGFMMANVVGMVLSGLWCDRHGPTRSVLAGPSVFTFGLLVAGTATYMPVFILGRGLQGFGSGLAIVPIYVIIGQVYPRQLRAKVFALVSAAWVVPALVGPVIAGALAEHGLWRLVFVGLLPLLGAAYLALRQVLRDSVQPADQPDRNYGRLLFAVSTGAGLAGVQLALERVGRTLDWVAAVLLVSGVALLVVGLRQLWPAGTIRLKVGIPATVMYRGLMPGAFFGMESLLPLTLKTLHGFSATTAGLPLLVGAIGWSLGSVTQGRSRAPRYVLVRIGVSLVTACALLMFGLILIDGAGWLSYVIWILGGLGMGMGMSSIGVLLLEFSPEADRGTDSAAQQISDAVMSSLCIGLGGALVAASVHGAMGFGTAVAVHTGVLATIIFVGVLFASRLRTTNKAAI